MCTLRLISIILAEISAHHLQLKCIGSHFFPCHPYIESTTTVLSDNESVSSQVDVCYTIIMSSVRLIRFQ